MGCFVGKCSAVWVCHVAWLTYVVRSPLYTPDPEFFSIRASNVQSLAEETTGTRPASPTTRRARAGSWPNNGFGFGSYDCGEIIYTSRRRRRLLLLGSLSEGGEAVFNYFDCRFSPPTNDKLLMPTSRWDYWVVTQTTDRPSSAYRPTDTRFPFPVFAPPHHRTGRLTEQRRPQHIKYGAHEAFSR